MVRQGSEPTSRAANQAIFALTTTWICVSVRLSRPEFTSLATLVNNQLVASCQLGISFLF